MQSVNNTFHSKNFEKLEQAVVYNHHHQLDLYDSKIRFPNAIELETVKENDNVQNEFIPAFPFNQFLCIYQNISYVLL